MRKYVWNLKVIVFSSSGTIKIIHPFEAGFCGEVISYLLQITLFECPQLKNPLNTEQIDGLTASPTHAKAKSDYCFKIAFVSKCSLWFVWTPFHIYLIVRQDYSSRNFIIFLLEVIQFDPKVQLFALLKEFHMNKKWNLTNIVKVHLFI